MTVQHTSHTVTRHVWSLPRPAAVDAVATVSTHAEKTAKALHEAGAAQVSAVMFDATDDALTISFSTESTTEHQQ